MFCCCFFFVCFFAGVFFFVFCFVFTTVPCGKIFIFFFSICNPGVMSAARAAGLLALDNGHAMAARISTCSIIASVHAARTSLATHRPVAIPAGRHRIAAEPVCGVAPERALDVLLELLASIKQRCVWYIYKF
jgi:hypothetical protein